MSTPLIRPYPHIPVMLPRERILKRMGYNRHRTVYHQHHLEMVESAMSYAFSLCKASGLSAAISIAAKDEESLELSTGHTLTSRSLLKLLEGSESVLLMAATVGQEIMDAIQEQIERADGARAAIFDAVGSETVDLALGWIHDYIRKDSVRKGVTVTDQRFSPGYGDLGLENQKTVFDLLQMETLRLALTDRFMLVPEKSVIGIAGMR